MIPQTAACSAVQEQGRRHSGYQVRQGLFLAHRVNPLLAPSTSAFSRICRPALPLSCAADGGKSHDWTAGPAFHPSDPQEAGGAVAVQSQSGREHLHILCTGRWQHRLTASSCDLRDALFHAARTLRNASRYSVRRSFVHSACMYFSSVIATSTATDLLLMHTRMIKNVYTDHDNVVTCNLT